MHQTQLQGNVPIPDHLKPIAAKVLERAQRSEKDCNITWQLHLSSEDSFTFDVKKVPAGVTLDEYFQLLAKTTKPQHRSFRLALRKYNPASGYKTIANTHRTFSLKDLEVYRTNPIHVLLERFFLDLDGLFTQTGVPPTPTAATQPPYLRPTTSQLFEDLNRERGNPSGRRYAGSDGRSWQ